MSESRNKVIHIVCVPLILTASAAMLEHFQVPLLPFKFSLALPALLAVLLYYQRLNKISGVIRYRCR